jgi:lipoprotein-anchoring transpeptidase ErfK/SrfK
MRALSSRKPLPSRWITLGVLIAAVILALAGLTVNAWAARMAMWSRGLDVAFTAPVTPTPTKTPRPPTRQPTRVPVTLTVITPAATPAPTISSAGAEVSVALSPYLAAVVQQYGMDPSRRFIVVDPNLQKMTIWDPGQPPRELPISTGDEARGYHTPAWYGLVGPYWGTFQAFGVYADEGWYLFEDVGSILIHGAPYRLVDGQKVYQDLDALGNYPASRGCIRLAPEDARWFTAWGPEGVPLVILPRAQEPARQ